MENRRFASICGLSVALLWGLSFLSIKVALREVPPMTMAVARFAIACAVLPWFARLAKEPLRVAARDLPLLAASGFVGVTLYFLGENHGVALLTASEASVIVGTIPVLTVLSERLFLGTRLGIRTYLGAVLSFLGVALIVVRLGGGVTGSVRGYLYMVLAALAWVAYCFLTRGQAARYGRITVTFWQLLFGLAGSVPFALSETAQWRIPSPAAVANIVFLGVFCSALGYWLFIVALDRLGPGRSSVFINLIPVVSVVAAFFILGERLSAMQWLGGGVAVAGVYLATLPSARPARPEAEALSARTDLAPCDSPRTRRS
jgi:drug/metabolite transporter (DMT)-like permease